MLRDDEKRRRMELEKIFGVDFGEPGDRGRVGLEHILQTISQNIRLDS